MSNSARNSKWANAGVVVSIEPEDVPEGYSGPFALLDYQHDIEKKMYDYVASKREEDPETQINPLAAPAQRMIDFCNGIISHDFPASSYRPGLVPAPLHKLLPEGVTERLRKAFPEINKRIMRGYFTNDALLLGVESRTSSPVRMLRDPETFMCPGADGLFPCGEGAGYSGGIVSSAIDGINCAKAALRYIFPESEPSEEASEASE
jgi:uncharacterized FAD-dependent dehydrogenase